MSERPEHGSVAWFDRLTQRDFENGATRDELREIVECAVHYKRAAEFATEKLGLFAGLFSPEFLNWFVSTSVPSNEVAKVAALLKAGGAIK